MDKHINGGCQPTNVLIGQRSNPCSVKRCRGGELLPIICPECKQNFCIRYATTSRYTCSLSTRSPRLALALVSRYTLSFSLSLALSLHTLFFSLSRCSLSDLHCHSVIERQGITTVRESRRRRWKGYHKKVKKSKHGCWDTFKSFWKRENKHPR